MTARQTVSKIGMHGDVSIALHERGRAGVKGVGMSLNPSSKESSLSLVTVEWLLGWAYARERVHLARVPGMGEAVLFAARGFPTSSSSERIGAAVGSSMNLGFEAPADAYAVMHAVDAQGAAAAMLRRYALMGGNARPDWTPRPVIRTQAGAKGQSLHVDASGKHRLCPFQLFSYRGDLAAIVEERRQVYGAWARGVASVHRALNVPGRLAAYALAPDLPPLAPWLDGD